MAELTNENDSWTIAFRALSAFPQTAVAMFREARFGTEDLRRQAPHELCSRGDTLLTRAARLGHLGAARALLDGGADLEWPTRATDLSPLQVACHCGHAELVRFFLERGASITRRNNRGLSAVSTAVHTMDVRCLDILARAGADLGSRGLARGNTLAQSAASRGNINALAYLASKGVNLFERDMRAARESLSRAPAEDRPRLYRRGLTSLDAAAKQRNVVAAAPGPNATLDFLHDVLHVGGAAASVAWTRSFFRRRLSFSARAGGGDRTRYQRATVRLPIVGLRALVLAGRAVPRRAPTSQTRSAAEFRRALVFLTSAFDADAAAAADRDDAAAARGPPAAGDRRHYEPLPHELPADPGAAARGARARRRRDRPPVCSAGVFRAIVAFI